MMGQARDDIETELKFAIGDGWREARGKPALFSGPGEVQRLTSVYYDTSGQTLRKAGLSLRVRRSADGCVQTLKTQAGADLAERGQFETGLADDNPDPKALGDTPAAAILDGAGPLSAMFSTEVERSVWIHRAGKSVIEVCSDAGEIIAASARQPIAELELELKGGPARALFDLAAKLVEVGGLTLAFDSKGDRGYRLADGDEVQPHRAGRLRLDGGMASEDAFRTITRNCLAQVSANALLLRRVRRPEALHQMRVGLRRLRTALSAFKDLAGGDGLDAIKAEAKWLAGELDEARDLDVFITSTFRPAEGCGDDPAQMATLGAALLASQTRAYERAAAAFGSHRCDRLLFDAARWAQAGDWTRAGGLAKALRRRPIAETGAEVLTHLHKQVCKGGRRFERLDAHGRHKLRIKAKKLRYVAEFLRGCFDDDGGRRTYVKRLKAFQDELGLIHDLDVAQERAIAAVGQESPQLSFAVGLVVGVRQADHAALLDSAKSTFAEVAEAEPYW